MAAKARRTSPRNAVTTHSETFVTMSSIFAACSSALRAFVLVCLPLANALARREVEDGVERTRRETREAKVRLRERSCCSAWGDRDDRDELAQGQSQLRERRDVPPESVPSNHHHQTESKPPHDSTSPPTTFSPLLVPFPSLHFPLHSLPTPSNTILVRHRLRKLLMRGRRLRLKRRKRGIRLVRMRKGRRQGRRRGGWGGGEREGLVGERRRL